LLLSLALASGGLAASRVSELERDVEARVGAPVPVVVAARDLSPDARIPRGALRLAAVPARYVPPDALAALGPAVGARSAVAVPRGGYLTAGALQPAPDRPAGGLRRGERAVDVAVAGSAGQAGYAPGARVDVLVSSEPGGGPGRTVAALEGVELLALRAGGGSGGDPELDGAAAAAGAVATLRVTLRQAVYLTAAENFAREVRLLARPPADRGRAGALSVSAAEL
jgi:pilus assembly protein CpaB